MGIPLYIVIIMVNTKTKVPGPVRAGIALLIVGAILGGAGTISNKDSLTFYGFVVVVLGFILYFTSSIYFKKQEKNKGKIK